jgi:hypothetical protein
MLVHTQTTVISLVICIRHTSTHITRKDNMNSGLLPLYCEGNVPLSFALPGKRTSHGMQLWFSSQLLKMQTIINSNKYEKWLKTKYIQNFPPNCLLVVDIAYQNMQYRLAPHSTTQKQEMNNWLSTCNSHFNKNLQTTLKTFKTHIHWEQHRHSVIQLPNYNQISIQWSCYEVVSKNMSQKEVYLSNSMTQPS